MRTTGRTGPSSSLNHDVVLNAPAVVDCGTVAVVVDAIEAGIAAARLETVLRDRVMLDGDRLYVTDTSHDLLAFDHVIVLGGDNAAGHVASVLESIIGDCIDDGIVVTDDPTEMSVVETVEGSHPVPDERAQEGARAILERAETAGPETLVSL